MTNHLRGRALAFLRHVGVLAGVLAVIAGILGMHVMTGTHDMPQASAAPGTDIPGVLRPAAPPQEPATADTGPATAASALSRMVSTPATACVTPDPCTEMSAMDAVCVPSAASTALAAPLPGSVPFAPRASADAAAPATECSYVPGSPSPGELCISRT
ncbi:hypothetical protein PV761_04095 [Arthrobacter sp. CC3]|uniref:hypothetical protein n=1 Tax=Arthrobacter sp. CC3 TaxID=3029185 RepID=UPI003264ECDD